jgi:NitT/TauT family transport system substrate-binding protein
MKLSESNNSRTVILYFLLLICLAFLLSACTQPDSPSPQEHTPLTVQLAWTHNAQFAGMYVADQQGFYADEGFAVTFLEGGPGVDPIKVVASGTAQFGLTTADVLLIEHSEGIPVRAIAVIFRRSPRVYVSLAASGITRPQDFVGRVISLNANGFPPFKALMQRIGVQPEKYTLVESTSDLAPFTSGQVQVRSVYLTNEVLILRSSGYELNIIYPDDYGFHNYGDTLIATDRLLAEDPDLALRFLRATLKGWTYAIENPDDVGGIVALYNPAADPALENQKMAASLPLVNTGEDFIGWMRLETWTRMEQALRDQGVLIAPLDVSQVFSQQFLEAIYK